MNVLLSLTFWIGKVDRLFLSHITFWIGKVDRLFLSHISLPCASATEPFVLVKTTEHLALFLTSITVLLLLLLTYLLSSSLQSKMSSQGSN